MKTLKTDMKVLSEEINRIQYFGKLVDGEPWIFTDEFIHKNCVIDFIIKLKEDIEKECLERYLKSDGVVCEKGDICDGCKKRIKRIDKLAGEKLI